MQRRATKPAAMARAPVTRKGSGLESCRCAAASTRKSGNAITSRLSHDRRQCRTARQARSFRPRCSVLSATAAAPREKKGAGGTGGPPRSEPASHATSRMARELKAKSVHSERIETLDAGTGHVAGAITPAAAAASSAAGSGRRPRRGRKRMAGRTPTSGKPGTSRGPSPSSVPSFRAPVGQALVQAGVPVEQPVVAERALPHHAACRVEARRVVRAHPAAVATADAPGRRR